MKAVSGNEIDSRHGSYFELYEADENAEQRGLEFKKLEALRHSDDLNDRLTYMFTYNRTTDYIIGSFDPAVFSEFLKGKNLYKDKLPPFFIQTSFGVDYYAKVDWMSVKIFIESLVYINEVNNSPELARHRKCYRAKKFVISLSSDTQGVFISKGKLT